MIPFLEKASSKVHLRELRGQCVAIDSYCWLHKGAFACADRLARGEETDIHIQYCIKYVNLLLSHDIKPILVFDGRHLPAKAMTESKRRETRDVSKKRAAELLREGRTEEAKSFLRRCVDITHEMALRLIQECRKRNVDCVVAPYEADAQLAYLNKKGIAQAVITEDSDLMLFGCSKVLFKLDLMGNGLLIEAEKLYLAMGCKEEKYSFDKFRYMCILSGCDYLESLPGIGLAKAKKFVLLTEETDVKKALSKIPAYLNMRQLSVSEEYKTDFMKADATFKHMVVYDPLQRKQTRLNEPEELGTDPELCSNAGTFLDEDIAFQLALGNYHPFSLKKLDIYHPDDPNSKPTGGKTTDWNQTSVSKHPSIWKGNYENRKIRCDNERTEPFVKKVVKSETVIKRQVERVESPEPTESVDDILLGYGITTIEQQPPRKKFCLTLSTGQEKGSSVEYDEQQALLDMETLEDKSCESPPSRNPFKITITSRRSVNDNIDSELTSPTMLTMENSSLLRNVKPVMKTEYEPKAPLVAAAQKQTNSKLEKLSRFKRTVLPTDNQKVISRFFANAPSSSAITSSEAEPSSPEPKKVSDEKQAASIYLHSPEAIVQNRGEKTPKKQAFHRHNSSSCSPAPPVKGEYIVEKMDSGFVEEPEGGFSSSQKENEDIVDKKTSRLQLFSAKPAAQLDCSNLADDSEPERIRGASPLEEVVEIDDDDVQVSAPVQRKTVGVVRAPERKRSQKTAPSRRVGLPKGKSAKDSGPIQSKLSMFGFQKKT